MNAETYFNEIAEMQTVEQIKAYTSEVMQGLKTDLEECNVQFSENGDIQPEQSLHLNHEEQGKLLYYDFLLYIRNWLNKNRYTILGVIDALGQKHPSGYIESYYDGIEKKLKSKIENCNDYLEYEYGE